MLKKEKELRQQLLDQSKNLRIELERSNTELLNKLNTAVRELGDEKTDRKLLADLLLEMARQLNKDFKKNILENSANEK